MTLGDLTIIWLKKTGKPQGIRCEGSSLELEADIPYGYDYFVDTQTFTLRMAFPSHKHEFVHTQLILVLPQRLQQLWSLHQAPSPFSIWSSAAIKDGRGSIFIPDNQIICEDIKLPILVLEVGDSQSIKSLNKKAFRYIQAGSGNIRYVVTLKLHRDSQAVDLTLSIPMFTSNGPLTVLEVESTSQTIRNIKGEHGNGAGLVMSVDHMTLAELLPKSIRDRTIVISGELWGIIRSAEKMEEATNPGYFSDIPLSFVRSPSPASTSPIKSDQEE
ncbi:uncharacterized protein PV07_11471 [Cladophialophora immunda]|uniref:Uncharacterized protein n=1 Tax=Cladophialophora immunda TaxID=569365 RepID=A0A0D2BY46_9EURO|nr:uncharacterized protein PV07_11471 [Cladophialophora immunda]KIW23260.1 hypothetical protein PV07_11471 [Cladophialophora immunda]